MVLPSLSNELHQLHNLLARRGKRLKYLFDLASRLPFFAFLLASYRANVSHLRARAVAYFHQRNREYRWAHRMRYALRPAPTPYGQPKVRSSALRSCGRSRAISRIRPRSLMLGRRKLTGTNGIRRLGRHSQFVRSMTRPAQQRSQPLGGLQAWSAPGTATAGESQHQEHGSLRHDAILNSLCSPLRHLAPSAAPNLGSNSPLILTRPQGCP